MPRTRARVRPRALCLLAALLGSACALVAPRALPAQQPAAPAARPVHLEFVHSPWADFLYYAFTRRGQAFSELAARIPLTGVPTLDQLISLPERAVLTRIGAYAELYALAEPYRTATSPYDPGPPPLRLGFGSELPPYDSIVRVLRLAEPHYPAFEAYWRSDIEPRERALVDAWRAQAAGCAPLDTLQRWARLPFPADTLRVAAIALHPAGSALPHPAALFSGLQRTPRLAWLIGHEATHLILDPPAADWRLRPRSVAALAAADALGLPEHQIEEVLAVFLQATLAQACHQWDPGVRFSSRIAEESPMKQLLVVLEDRWDAYVARPANALPDGPHARDLAEFLLDGVLETARRSGQGGR